jgi:hypothetical protein
MPAHDTTNTLSSLIFTTWTRASSKGRSIGISKAIRGNADVFAIWSTGNAKKLDLLMIELSGMIRKEKLSKAYNTVMNKDHIDRHASRG